MFIRFAYIGLLVAAVIFGGRFLREFATEIREVRQHVPTSSTVVQQRRVFREAGRTALQIENNVSSAVAYTQKGVKQLGA